jgi:hypothetical protein
MTDARSEIEAQMQLYFDGLYFSDIDRLARVFAADSRYVCATDGEIVNLGMEDYLPMVAGREAPAARNEQRHDKIVSIDVAGPETALVLARCAIGPRHFTDYLSFIKTTEGWRIIAKVFHYDIVPSAVEPLEEQSECRT